MTSVDYLNDFDDSPILCPCCRAVEIKREDGSWCAACGEALDRHHAAAVRADRGLGPEAEEP